MKKILLSAIAVGALAAAGAASAQDVPGSYRDEYGRLWVVEPGGRHVVIPESLPFSPPPVVTADGRVVPGGTVVDYSYLTRRYHEADSDRDGVPDSQDRRPFNPRRH